MPEPRMTISAYVSPDEPEFAVIQLGMDDEPRGHIKLIAAELEGFIHALATVREQMAEQVPEYTLLALRHPGLGWLGFALEPPRASQIATALKNPQGLPPTETKT